MDEIISEIDIFATNEQWLSKTILLPLGRNTHDKKKREHQQKNKAIATSLRLCVRHLLPDAYAYVSVYYEAWCNRPATRKSMRNAMNEKKNRFFERKETS